jgi:predicted acetyltransferase
MHQPQLIKPQSTFKESYISALKEYKAEGLAMYKDFKFDEVIADVEGYIERLEKESNGEGLPAGYVPHTTFWLVDDGEYIGRVDIRHELNDFLLREGGHIGYDVRPSKRGLGYGKEALRLGLEKAKELNIDNVLITCDVGNASSNAIIKSQGGALEEAVTLPNGTVKNRYWITNKANT